MAFPSSIPAAPAARRQRRAERTRTQILEAAARAFARDGYAGTSLNAILRESGVTKGAFYFHFASKEELALAAFRFKQEEILARTRAEVAEPADALEELAAVVRTRARIYAEDPSMRAVLRLGAELGATAGPGSEFARFQELTVETFADIVRRGQRQGVIRAGLDPRATGEALLGALIGTDRMSRLLSGGSDLEARSERLLELLVAGLAAQTRPPA